MASNDYGWMADTVGDFIHSPIWIAPIQTFIEEHCAAFDYDEDDEDGEGDTSAQSSMDEQKQIFHKYQKVVDSLINGLRHDLDLDENDLRRACELPSDANNAGFIDEAFEQLYAARDFQLFQEMMRRKNLILQLQALVSLQLQWGILKHSETGEDLILKLLIEATKAPSRRSSVDRPAEPIEPPSPSSVEERKSPRIPSKAAKEDHDDDDDVIDDKKRSIPPSKPSASSTSTREKKDKVRPAAEKPSKEPYRLPDLRRKDEVDVDWYRSLRSKEASDDDEKPERVTSARKTSTPQTIGNVSEDLLRQKLKELTDQTTSSVDEKTAAAIKSRKDFLQEQRRLLMSQHREELKKDIEQETRNARPQSAAHAARRAMGTGATAATDNSKDQSDQTPKISEEELAKRRALHEKLRRGVINKP